MEKKKIYEKPAYEAEEIFEKMSLACKENPGSVMCKAQTGICKQAGQGWLLVS